MKSPAFAGLLLAMFLNNALATDKASDAEAAKNPGAEVEIDVAPSKPGAAADAPPVELYNFCFFAGRPASDLKYTVVKTLKVAKGTYGSVKDILPKFAASAQSSGADAIIDYAGSQRFGFFPWRMVRPVVRGTAIKWSSPPAKDCAAMGGSTLNAIMSSGTPPAP